MQSLIAHARAFGREAAQRGEDLAALAAGQTPQALFISCSDSRVVPSLITGARPGELFELRTAGNIVPGYRPGRPSSESATIEFAVEILGVTEIIVCGHSHCGAVGAIARGDDLTALPALRDWLRHAGLHPGSQSPRAAANEPGPDLTEPVQHHVLHQLQRLRAHRCVAAAMGEGRLRLHAWFYEVHTGSVLAHQPHADAFLPL
jgi:carbonic anhydrase